MAAKRPNVRRHKATAEAPDQKTALGNPVTARLLPATRTCLKCGREFRSAWCGNRMCANCSKRGGGMDE